MREVIRVSKPILEAEEKQAVMSVLDSGMVAQGPEVRQLEEEFADYCGAKYAVALNSGTAALHTALHAAKVGPGDRIITSPFTFIATANSILMQGARPKFVDIDPATFNLDVSQLEAAYDPNVKAVLPVDLYGQPADYDEISDFAVANELAIVEDACQAVGAEYKNKRVGTLGQAACFSLYATKNIMSAEGGLITTDDERVAAEAKSFRQHGMDMNGQYDYMQLGYNYRTTDVLAAIARVQLAKANEFNRARIANAAKLTEGLKDIPGLLPPRIKADRTSVFHQYTVRVTPEFPVSRDDFISIMKDKGIITAVYYPRPLYLYPHLTMLGHSEGDFPEAERAAREVVSLPVHPSLSSDDIEYIVDSIKEIANARTD